jgi:hypothetical protein
MVHSQPGTPIPDLYIQTRLVLTDSSPGCSERAQGDLRKRVFEGKCQPQLFGPRTCFTFSAKILAENGLAKKLAPGISAPSCSSLLRG